MSDRLQGPGWWQGMDGKWYPPVAPMTKGPAPKAKGPAPKASVPIVGIGLLLFVLLIGIGAVSLFVSALMWTSPVSSRGFDCGSVLTPKKPFAPGQSFDCIGVRGSRKNTLVLVGAGGVLAFVVAVPVGLATLSVAKHRRRE